MFVGNFYFGDLHPMKPHRIRLAHTLATQYDLLKHMEVRIETLSTWLLFDVVRVTRNYLGIVTVRNCSFFKVVWVGGGKGIHRTQTYSPDGPAKRFFFCKYFTTQLLFFLDFIKAHS